MEFALSPFNQSTRIGRLVQRFESHEHSNGRIDASLQQRRILPSSKEFRAQCLGDCKFLLKFNEIHDLIVNDFVLFIRLGSFECWANRNFKIGKTITLSIEDYWPALSGGF